MHLIEPLEARIAPAAFITYTDSDGDLVKITASKGPLDAADLTFVSGGAAPSLALLTLTDPGFQGAAITFAVTAKGGGDGRVKVAEIYAAGVDLKSVTIKGDLQMISVGDGAEETPGLGLLSVGSLGPLAYDAQGSLLYNNARSIVGGSIGALKIAADFEGGRLEVYGGIGSITIGGSFLAAPTLPVGTILSAHITATGKIGNVTIGGDFAGGAGEGNGMISAGGALGNVKIGRDLLGGGGEQSGYIHGATIGNISIAGDLVGGSIGGSSAVTDSGVITSEGRIASVTIGKSLIAGTDTSTGALTRSGAIVAESLGPVKIGIGIVGNAENPALILAKGLAVKPATGFDLAIASLTVKGDVRFASIRAGFGSDGAPANADAAIGAVSVGGNWVASNLIAGAQHGGSGFGLGSTLQTVGNTGLVARIASIAIKGVVQGTGADSDQFGFVAEQIVKLSIGGKPIALTKGASNDTVPIPTTNDVHLVEVTVAPV